MSSTLAVVTIRRHLRKYIKLSTKRPDTVSVSSIRPYCAPEVVTVHQQCIVYIGNDVCFILLRIVNTITLKTSVFFSVSEYLKGIQEVGTLKQVELTH